MPDAPHRTDLPEGLHVSLPASGPDGELPGVALLVLDRPDVLNALDFALIAALTDALEALDSNPACRVMVITGAGDRAFAAVAVIRQHAPRPPTSLMVDDHSSRGERINGTRKRIGVT